MSTLRAVNNPAFRECREVEPKILVFMSSINFIFVASEAYCAEMKHRERQNWCHEMFFTRPENQFIGNSNNLNLRQYSSPRK